MTVIALIFSLLVAALGALGLVSPSRLLIVVGHFQTPAGQYFAAAVRLVMGVALLFAAPVSRAPGALGILGLIIILAGFITIFISLERFRRLIAWWSSQGSALVRAWAAVACAFGLLLAYALLP
jgi:hypothetical protein